MSSYWYREKLPSNQRPGIKECEYCQHQFDNEVIEIVEERFEGFGRGDDEVHAFCSKHKIRVGDSQGIEILDNPSNLPPNP